MGRDAGPAGGRDDGDAHALAGMGAYVRAGRAAGTVHAGGDRAGRPQGPAPSAAYASSLGPDRHGVDARRPAHPGGAPAGAEHRGAGGGPPVGGGVAAAGSADGAGGGADRVGRLGAGVCRQPRARAGGGPEPGNEQECGKPHVARAADGGAGGAAAPAPGHPSTSSRCSSTASSWAGRR